MLGVSCEFPGSFKQHSVPNSIRHEKKQVPHALTQLGEFAWSKKKKQKKKGNSVA
jgi:hypothetical protein